VPRQRRCGRSPFRYGKSRATDDRPPAVIPCTGKGHAFHTNIEHVRSSRDPKKNR
jgi:hypothetical protein